MARKLVVCCDGTWNTPRAETNVFRTYRFLREALGTPSETGRGEGVRTCSGRAADGSEGVLFYDAGGGTEWFSPLLGGGGGGGLSANLRGADEYSRHHFVSDHDSHPV